MKEMESKEKETEPSDILVLFGFLLDVSDLLRDLLKRVLVVRVLRLELLTYYHLDC